MDICDLFVAMNRLNDMEKEVIKLKFLQNNNSYKDIGNILNITPSWAMKLEFTALKKLRKDLED